MGVFGWPPGIRRNAELCLTPLLGLAGLCAYSLHDHRSLWHSLGDKLAPTILLAVPLLVLAAIVMRILKALRFPLWAGLIIAAAFSCFLVGAFYFLAAPYAYGPIFRVEPRIADEGGADIIAIWQYEAPAAGVIAAIATILSGLISSRLSKSSREA